jgi:hypothetical protein
MRIIKGVQLFICAAMLCAVLGTGAKADDWNKKTTVTFADSVEIPGQVLPAGTYVFMLADSNSNRHVVEIWTGDETQLLATLLTIPDYRPESPDKTIIELDERPGDSPMAIHTWFFPDDRIGQEFVYPRS